MKDTMAGFTKTILVSIIMAATLAGCASRDRSVGLAPNIEVAALSQLPAPSGVTPYTVGKQEQLEITVADAESMSGTYLTDSEGYISFPLVGDLFVAGKTPNQTAKMIADRLRGEYIVNPQVRVRPTSMIAPSISIGGEVTNPGTYPAATSQTLLRAVNNAGGLAEYAKVDDVLLIRTVDNKRYIGVYNIEAIQRGNYEDPIIFPGDVVTVGDSVGRRNLENILQFIPLLSTSAILIDRTFN
ncbi:polysaccharide biosynthesis/export family protein [Pontixanthobacter aestiaquae]|uniref:Polysaccharide export protein n=1 Tax=Pontixanthobacter aestiaquae TaxID=1509367 RepID=A0A844Z825_9SPHN|nr:polysaccharide biosynthesis/export family protein [Pontixanthobacter aestiaquae]MDN3646960.1 polysaccharide biosynthesis/export family protein [Pontixanthobacter aestiaquae]MXO82059.1 polysaccharide export protein [Pontixanthobacter aestiaquae]